MLFWFDYLTADVLGVSMCIDRVQNKPTTLFQILLTLFKLWMKISWSLKVFFISVQALYSYPNPTLEDLLSLSLFFCFFCCQQSDIHKVIEGHQEYEQPDRFNS